MAKSRKDNKGRVLRKGESYRSSDGKYQYAYADEAGKRRYIYSKNLTTLRQREEQILRDKLDGIDSGQAKNQTLNDIFDKYMATRKDLAERTFAGYMYQYNAYVRKGIGNRKVKDIKYSDVLLFYKKLMEESNLSYGTVEHLQRELHPAFEMAVRDCIIRTNPTHNVLGQLKKQTGAKRGVRNALTPEQQTAFLEFMDGHPVYDHWKPIYTFFIGTGLRVGELSGLTYISTPKTDAGIRKIPMVKEVRQALKEIKQYQHDNGIFCTTEIDGYTDFVFLNRFGRVFLQQDLDRALERIIDAYNDAELHEAKMKNREPLILPHFTCHSLHHTFCARFCENESNLKVIQSVMGHVDIATTMNIYAEVSEAKKKASMEALAEKMVLFSQ